MNRIKKVSNAGIYKGYLTGITKKIFDRYSINERSVFVDCPDRHTNHVILIGKDDNILVPRVDFVKSERLKGDVYRDDQSRIYVALVEKEEQEDVENQSSTQERPAQKTSYGHEYASTRKERIVRVLYDKLVERRKFIDRVPSSLSSFILDNEYTSSVEISLDRTIDFIFEHDSGNYVQWFFYEWRPGFKITTAESVDGGKTVYKIDNIDDFIGFLHKETQVLAD